MANPVFINVKGILRCRVWPNLDLRHLAAKLLDNNDTKKDRAVSGDLEIQETIRQGSVLEIDGEAEALAIGCKGGWEIEALMTQIDIEQNAQQGFFDLNFKTPKHFT